MLIRGFYYDSWNPDAMPVKIKTREEFYNYVAEKYPGREDIDAKKATTAVMDLLSDKISRGEIEDIRAILPSSLL